MTLGLVLVSDIHFRGYGSGWDVDADQRAELIRDLRRFVVPDGAIDGLVVGGDVAFRAHPSEYEAASAWLSDVCTKCGLDPSRVWTVPGNHDIDRDALEISHIARAFHEAIRACATADLELELQKRLSVDPAGDGVMVPFRNYNRFATEYVCSVTAEQPHWFDTTLACDGRQVRLTGLNSALISDNHDGTGSEERKLVLGTWQSTIPREDEVIRIAVCHHPPNWVRDWDVVEPFLRRAHLLLFGHEHRFEARQPVPGQTLYVYAGAVAPERVGGLPEDEYLPSWHLLGITCVEDELRITVEPRVWDRVGTCFAEHPDGVHTFRVALDLVPAEGDPIITDEVESEGMRAIAASPLADADSGDLDDQAEAVRRRGIGVRFMKLPATRRLEIAKKLGVIEEPDDLDLPQAKMYELILTRIRDRSLVERLIEELDRG